MEVVWCFGYDWSEKEQEKEVRERGWWRGRLVAATAGDDGGW